MIDMHFEINGRRVQPHQIKDALERNGKVGYAKRIPFTDFQLPTLSLFVADKVIMLPTEY